MQHMFELYLILKLNLKLHSKYAIMLTHIRRMEFPILSVGQVNKQVPIIRKCHITDNRPTHGTTKKRLRTLTATQQQTTKSQLQQTTNFATSLLIFEINKV